MQSHYDPAIVESGWSEQWQRDLQQEPKTENKKFSILLPPPNVTGVLHIGHALTVAIEDSLIRWNRQNGNKVAYIAGVDHAGIATQTMVEKYLTHTENLTRTQLGREEFAKRCEEFVSSKRRTILEQIEKLGCSADLSKPYYTLDEKHSMAVNAAFVRLFNEGLIYRAKKIVNWCTKLQTCVSTVEVEHREELGKLYFVDYELTDKTYLTVATTRPETILGDTGMALHVDDERREHLTCVEAINPITKRLMPIVFEDWVDKNFGTGVVKLTPAHSADDYAAAIKHNLAVFQVFDDKGQVEIEGRFKGLDRFQAQKAILNSLMEQGRLRETRPHLHSVSYCSRSGDVIEPMLRWQWFLKCSDLAARAIKAVQTGQLHIQPKNHVRTWERWLNEPQDWCISRQLWFGHQIPAYYDRVQSKWTAASSQTEAETITGSKDLVRDEDVLDTWFSSSILPLSTAGWPGAIDRTLFPYSILETGYDILFFWVARMTMMSIALVDEVPFKTVALHNIVRDSDGRKMSKSLGNVIDPLDVIHGKSLADMQQDLQQKSPLLSDKERRAAVRRNQRLFPNGLKACGSDALRFTLLELTLQTTDINLDVKKLIATRHWCNKIWNAVRFCVQFEKFVADVDVQQLPIPCLWIRRKCYQAHLDISSAMIAAQPATACAAIRRLWQDQICDVFIELVKKSDGRLRKQYVMTLYTAISMALILLHPFMPFLSEHLYCIVQPQACCLFSKISWEFESQQLGKHWSATNDEDMQLLFTAADSIRSKTPTSLKVDIRRLEKYEWELDALSRTTESLKTFSV